MTYVLQVDFPMNGPFGDEMAEAFSETAQSINKEKGFIWKIWTENDETNEAGGISSAKAVESVEISVPIFTCF